MNKTLVLFAHPYYEHSQTNARLIQAYQNCEHITFRDLYEDYPDFNIQAFKERKRMVVYDTLIFHFPLIWFGMPPLLKLWIDEVFDMKWIAENDIPNPLLGKKVHLVVTAGGSPHAFSDIGKYHYPLETFLAPLTQCIEISGMTLESSHFIYNADNLSYPELEEHYNTIKKLTLL
ncbi:NAD(P)H-dependent oxidoreductase [Elizabethkingia sp. JS20170427COW]|uniref:NAD(P)H-dependent oxidoreductase n=1 Tax=Elizabethkingia sp. JS20170427COW TaxID=2583851 RepID=UPI00111045F4|nr:NAD(P)H-dependent oxidoreductase [Elizabethkingia sp. JS20170427COW]QCX53450.1 NAD(P)H-dependent oxidoreductase [Elizabethkingia sp. JS20170427COW]